MAVINGAASLDEVIKTVKAGFFSVIRVRVPCMYLVSIQFMSPDFLGRVPSIYDNCTEVCACGGMQQKMNVVSICELHLTNILLSFGSLSSMLFSLCWALVLTSRSN